MKRKRKYYRGSVEHKKIELMIFKPNINKCAVSAAATNEKENSGSRKNSQHSGSA